MKLTFVDAVAIPPGGATEFDHGDVFLKSGCVFIAHTAAGAIAVVDPDRKRVVATIPGCPGASGVLCAQEAGLVFAAARGAGKVLVIDATTFEVLAEIAVGSRPNGLAWDDRRNRLLVADVVDNTVRLVDPALKKVVAERVLPGRPRWCVYDREQDRFLVNVREPSSVAAVDADGLAITAATPISASGPHGMDIDHETSRVFIACDGAKTIALDLESGREIGSCSIPGVPDATWFNAARNLIYVAVGTPGVVSVIDASTMTVVEEIATEPGAGTTAFDGERQQLYVFLPQTSRMAIYKQSS